MSEHAQKHFYWGQMAMKTKDDSVSGVLHRCDAGRLCAVQRQQRLNWEVVLKFRNIHGLANCKEGLICSAADIAGSPPHILRVGHIYLSRKATLNLNHPHLNEIFGRA